MPSSERQQQAAPVTISNVCGWSAQKEISKAGRLGICGGGGSRPWLIA